MSSLLFSCWAVELIESFETVMTVLIFIFKDNKEKFLLIQTVTGHAVLPLHVRWVNSDRSIHNVFVQKPLGVTKLEYNDSEHL